MNRKNVEQLVANSLQTKLGGTMNNLVRNIVEVGESSDKRFFYFKLRSGREFYIDTYKNTYAASMNRLEVKNKVSYIMNRSCSNIRPCMSYSVPQDTNNSKPQLAVAIALVDELYNGICRPDYTGLSVNHKDLTGNSVIYGYTNNHIENLELVTGSENTVHGAALSRAHEVLNVHLQISAQSPDINVFRFGTESDIRSWFKKEGYKYVV